MTIDCHYHLDPRLQTVESLIAQMKHHRIETTVLMPYICEPVKPPGEMTLSLFRFFLKHRSFRTLAKRLSANFTENGDLKVPSGLVTIHPDPDNAPVFETVRAYPDQFRAWIFVNPNGNKAQVDVYKQWRDADGAIGVKAHPFWHRYPPEALLPVAELLVKDNRPIIMHMGYNPSFDGDLDSLINELPDLKVILAHAAFPDYHDRWKSIKANSNIYVDLSATGFVDKAITQQVVEFLGPERCLFGSDGPYWGHDSSGEFDQGILKRRIEALFPDKGIQQRILRKNFLEITGTD